MGARGAEPDNKIVVIDPRPRERSKPFSKMSGAAKVVWKRIVDDFPAGHFQNHELDQLRAYCEAVAMNAEAITIRSRRIPKNADSEDVAALMTEKAEALKTFRTTSYVMAALGTKLRLNKNSKLTNKEAAKVETGKPRSRREGLMFGGRAE